MWQPWPERQIAVNSLGRRISKAQLIYNIDHNMKSSCVPKPELIKSAGRRVVKGSKDCFAYKLEDFWEQIIRILIA